MKNNKIILVVFLGMVCLLGISYAAFSQNLTVNGTGNIASTWKVEIDTTNSSCSVTSKDSSLATVASVSKTTTTFSTTIKWASPGDVVTCDVRVKNSGTLDAKVAMTGVKLYTTSSTSTACANVTATAQGTPYTGTTAGTKVPASPVTITASGVTVGTLTVTHGNYAIFTFKFTYSSTATTAAGTCTFTTTTKATQ